MYLISEINVAVKPLSAKELSEEKIIDAIEEIKRTYEEKKKNAEEISYKIRSEEGLARTVRLITNVLNKVYLSSEN